MLTILIFSSFLSLSLIVHALAIQLGVRAARPNRPRFLRALAAAVTAYAVSIAVDVAVFLYFPPTLMSSIAALLTCIFLQIIVIRLFFRLTFPKAALAWLPTLGAMLAMLALALFVLRPYLLEAYRIPAANMVPTFVNDHYVATCPHCGGTLLVPLTNLRSRPNDPPQPPDYGVCTKCFQISPVDFSKISHDLTTADRFMVAKFLTPNRLDIIAFHHSSGDIYIKRLIALPGETVFIDADQIFVNGTPISFSGDLAKIKWSTLPGMLGRFVQADFATRENPLILAPDQCFVLGDDPAHSSDSRFFGPIKQRAIIGPATIIYWPPSRFRIFR